MNTEVRKLMRKHELPEHVRIEFGAQIEAIAEEYAKDLMAKHIKYKDAKAAGAPLVKYLEDNHELYTPVTKAWVSRRGVELFNHKANF